MGQRCDHPPDVDHYRIAPAGIRLRDAKCPRGSAVRQRSSASLLMLAVYHLDGSPGVALPQDRSLMARWG
jgi:hypothetical protein